MAESVRNLWGKKSDSVVNGATKVLDSIPLARFHRLEYIVTIVENGGSKSKSLRMLVNRGENGLTDQVFALEGDTIQTEISANVNGSLCEIGLKNNELFLLDVTLVKLKI